MKVGGGPNTVGLVFGYDMASPKCAEPTTNYIWHQNADPQESYTTYSATSTGNWNNNHYKAIRAYRSDGGEITGYVNTGVGNWEETHHAHWQYDDELGKPVVVQNAYDGNWKAKSYGASMGDWSSLGMSSGDKYTISWLQWSSDLSLCADAGLYCRDGSGNYNFHDGRSYGNTRNTLLNTWQRVSYTFTISPNRNLSDSYGSVYMYGHTTSNNNGVLKIADVQLELKDHDTKFSPTLSRTNSLGNIGSSTVSIDISNIGWSTNEYPSFNGSSYYLDLGEDLIVSPDRQGWTAEYIFKTTNGGLLQHFNSAENDEFNANWLALYNGKLAVWNRSPGYWKYGSTSFSSDTWYHAVFISDDGGTNMRFYVNGIAEGGDHVGNVWNADYSSLECRYVGRYEYQGGYSRYFSGEIPVVRMYNRALSSEEVYQNYLSYKPRFGLV